jgi:lipopolysaccharide transport system permease protein
MAAQNRITILRPQRKIWGTDLGVGEALRSWELLWILALRDVKVRYKQTILGVAWAVIQPLVTMIVFSIFFGHLAGIGERIEGGIPYPIYTFCALLPWQLFAHALTASSNSLLQNERLITRVYFPRLTIPIASLGSGLVDFSIAFVILGALMLYFGVGPGWAILTLPLFIALAALAALAVGLWLASLSVIYRDFKHTVPFLTQFWLFMSPVAYPSSLVPEAWRPLYALNPMVGVIDGFRWALIGHARPPWMNLTGSVLVVLLLLVTGLLNFRRMERTFADWI